MAALLHVQNKFNFIDLHPARTHVQAMAILYSCYVWWTFLSPFLKLFVKQQPLKLENVTLRYLSNQYVRVTCIDTVIVSDRI